MSDSTALPITMRAMELSDTPAVIELHRRYLHRGFFVDLGERFLGLYYRTFLTSPAAVALIAERDGGCVGFLVGTVNEAAHRRHVARLDRARLARAGALSLAAKPQLTARFFRTRARRYARGLDSARRQDGPRTGCEQVGVLHHVAVDESARRSGTGRALAGGFADVARSHGTGRLRLYAEGDNDAAHAFYLSQGWSPAGKSTDVEGQEWVTFVRDL